MNARMLGRLIMRVSCLVAVVGCDGLAGTNEVDVESTQVALSVTSDFRTDWGGVCNGYPGTATVCQVRDSAGNNPMNMHCCPAGFGMEGLYASTDTLLCRGVTYNQGASQNLRTACKWRGTTTTVEGKTFLGCAEGEYMIGYHGNLTRVACCPTGGTVVRRVDGDNEAPLQSFPFQVAKGFFMDPGCSVSSTVHICNRSQNELMSGVHANNNWFMCSR